MFPLWNFFLQKDRFTYVLAFFLVIAGIVSVITIPKESNPEIKVPIGVVTTFLPGASAQDVEKLITNKIEDGLSNLENVDSLTSTSRESLSSVVVEFDANADLDKSIDELKDEVDKVKRELPSEAEDPEVTQVDFSSEPILLISLSSDLPLPDFRDIIEETKDEIKSVSGVSEVNIQGLPEREVQVILDQEKLETFGLSIIDVVGIVSASNSSLPIGSIEIDSINYAVRFEGDIEAPSEIGDVTIPGPSGAPVYLRDIAFISDGSVERSNLSRVSVEGVPSEQSVTLAIVKRSGGNILEISDNVKATLDRLSESTLNGVTILYSFDISDFIREDLGNLVRSGLQTVILVTLLLLVFVGTREALIAGLAIPFSFLISFIGLSASGNTINFVSLFSLILAIGILVDSAIVITEAMHTKIKAGTAGIAAAVSTLQEYSWPLISGTMTTVAAFAPLFFISGITGEFIKSIPFTIIFVLLASLFVALGIIPLASAVMIKKNGDIKNEDDMPWSERMTKKLQGHYFRLLDRLVGKRKQENKVIAFVIIVWILAFMMPITGLLKVTFFPQGDIDFIYIEIEKPFGTTLAETDLATREVEEYLYDENEIDSFVVTVGASSSFGNNPEGGEHLANININLKEERERTSGEIVAALSEKLAPVKSAEIDVLQSNDGPPTGAPIFLKFLGEDLDELEAVANRAEEILKEISGTKNVSTSVKDNGLEYTLTIDRARAASFGITSAQVAQTLRGAINGIDSTTIRYEDTDIDVLVKMALNDDYATPDETSQTTIDTVRLLSIPTQNGPILLDTIVDIEVKQGSAIIRHEEKERVVTVSAFIEDGFVLAEIIPAFYEREDELGLSESVRLDVGGEAEDVDQSFRDMGVALIVGMFLIASILLVQFNSIRYVLFIIVVPILAVGGLLWGLTITRQTLSFPSLMGFITLAGIVVNNAIILIDASNNARKESEVTLRQAAITAAVSRLRPIILTTLTTVAGMVPLIIVSQLWGPLAIAVIFGLTYSLLLTLVLVPIMYGRWGKGYCAERPDRRETKTYRYYLKLSSLLKRIFAR